jgi:predicted RNase H-like HicB family nuclease
VLTEGKHDKKIMTSIVKKKIQIATDYGSHSCVFKSDGEDGFIVTAPDVEGMITWGKNMDHAKKMAKECLELCVECLVERRLRKGSRQSAKVAERASA